MIDVHCHILPNIDDGAQCALDSLNLMEEAYGNGFSEIITTSHFISNGRFQASIDERKEIIDSFKEVLKQKGINLRLYNGAEAYITPDLPQLYVENVIPTMANSRYVLFELPMSQKPVYTENVINELINMGYLPIIAHPERYDYVKEDINEALRWVEMGAYLQCNYGSLVGNYGMHAKKTLQKLLKEDAVTFLGTDTHRPNTNYCNIDKMIKVLKKEVNEEKADALTFKNPEKIILDKAI